MSGSFGHVSPMLGVAATLEDQGHDVGELCEKGITGGVDPMHVVEQEDGGVTRAVLQQAAYEGEELSKNIF